MRISSSFGIGGAAKFLMDCKLSVDASRSSLTLVTADQSHEAANKADPSVNIFRLGKRAGSSLNIIP